MGIHHIRVILALMAICLPFQAGTALADAAAAHINTQASGSARNVFRVGFPPDENPQEIVRKNAPLLEYLRGATGIQEMEIVVPATYTAAVEQMQRGELDMVYFGGLTYVLAKKEVEITPIVRGVVGGTAENFTFIIARKDRGINSLTDLHGKTFAFGDVASTSGSLIPHRALLNAGIDPNRDLKKVVYTGAHDKTALAVFNGDVDAGAMNSRKYPDMIKKGQISEDVVQVIFRSEPFADYPWAVRDKVGQDLIAKLRRAFVELKDTKMLALLGVEGFETTTDQDFENLRAAAKRLGFLED